MNTKISRRAVFQRDVVIGCLVLGMFATTISLSLSVSVGWRWGDSVQEKWMMAAFGMLAVLSAHLLLGLCRPAAVGVRMVATALWLFCIAYVAYSHANYFLSLQGQAGSRRVAAIDPSSLPKETVRKLSEILADQANIKTELAAKSLQECRASCARLEARLTNLKARLDALNAEAEEVRRWQRQHDRHQAQQDAVRDDPVTVRLAKWSGVSVTQIELIISLFFSCILEGVACLCWYVVLQCRDSPVTQPVMQSVTAIPGLPGSRNVVDSHLPSELDTKVEELVRVVKAGQLNLSVTEVRKYCRCAQKKAAELKRLVAMRLNNAN